jgi:hypothetical protein
MDLIKVGVISRETISSVNDIPMLPTCKQLEKKSLLMLWSSKNTAVAARNQA